MRKKCVLHLKEDINTNSFWARYTWRIDFGVIAISFTDIADEAQNTVLCVYLSCILPLQTVSHLFSFSSRLAATGSTTYSMLKRRHDFQWKLDDNNFSELLGRFYRRARRKKDRKEEGARSLLRAQIFLNISRSNKEQWNKILGIDRSIRKRNYYITKVKKVKRKGEYLTFSKIKENFDKIR